VVVADLHDVTLVEGHRSLDEHTVDLDAVVAVEVLDHPAIRPLSQPRVLPRDVLLGELDGVSRFPTDRDFFFTEGHDRRCALFVFDDQSQAHCVRSRVGSGSKCCQARTRGRWPGSREREAGGVWTSPSDPAGHRGFRVLLRTYVRLGRVKRLVRPARPGRSREDLPDRVDADPLVVEPRQPSFNTSTTACDGCASTTTGRSASAPRRLGSS
jgi:hypothetical protein